MNSQRIGGDHGRQISVNYGRLQGYRGGLKNRIIDEIKLLSQTKEKEKLYNIITLIMKIASPMLDVSHVEQNIVRDSCITVHMTLKMSMTNYSQHKN